MAHHSRVVAKIGESLVLTLVHPRMLILPARAGVPEIVINRVAIEHQGTECRDLEASALERRLVCEVLKRGFGIRRSMLRNLTKDEQSSHNRLAS